MSDTPPINLTVARSQSKQAKLTTRIKRKEVELKNQTKQKEAYKKYKGFSKKGLYLEEEAIEIAKKLKEFPGFLVGDRLLSFKGNKSYKINDFHGFVALIIWHLAICTKDIHDEVNTSLESLDKALADFAISIKRAFHREGIRNNPRFLRKAKKLKEAYDNIYLACNSLIHELKPDVMFSIKHLIGAFLHHVPQATNADIARHILILVESLGGIPHTSMPTYSTLRQTVSKTKKDIKENNEWEGFLLRDKLWDKVCNRDSTKSILFYPKSRTAKMINKIFPILNRFMEQLRRVYYIADHLKKI